MTKTRNFKYYGNTFKAYCKPVGHGYEVGCTFEGKHLFVGNFVHREEANAWWTHFCGEITTFFGKYEFPYKTSSQWMTKFFGSYMYKSYYAWLDKKFTKYTKEYTKAFKQGDKTYRKHFTHSPSFKSLRFAA
ncbi:MAG: hypothetical protein K2X47_16150 [Bdellovibrionales bacterium]|nr:hypothetical protein [Bdellovibrionales bacterium]